jgi:flagellar basal-body rod modification protein FlgD
MVDTDYKLKDYEVKPKEPKVVDADYVQSVDSLSAQDFMQIYLETLKYQDPFQQTDISKSIDDMVKLNQIRYFSEVMSFMEGLTAWMNQITFVNSLNFVGKEFVFKTDTIDTLKGGNYYILSSEELTGVKVQILDGEEVIKEIEMDIKKGLNSLDIGDLPKGQFTVKLTRQDTEVVGWQLGFLDKITAVGILEGELMFDLESGRKSSADAIIYAGGVGA